MKANTIGIELLSLVLVLGMGVSVLGQDEVTETTANADIEIPGGEIGGPDESMAAPEDAEPAVVPRLTSYLAERYEVSETQVNDMRAAGMGYGEIEISLALAEAIGDQGSMNDILGAREDGMGWGEIAQQHGLNLGQVMRAARRATPERPNVPIRPEVPGVPDWVETPERPERPERPVRPEQIGPPDAPGRPDAPKRPETPGRPDNAGRPGGAGRPGQ